MKWTDEETERLLSMVKLNTPFREIASTLGRSIKSVQTRYEYVNLTPRQREERKQRLYATRHKQTPVRRRESDRLLTSSRPDAATLDERDLRNAAPVRDLTGLLLGDPPRGYSALDQLLRRSA